MFMFFCVLRFWGWNYPYLVIIGLFLSCYSRAIPILIIIIVMAAYTPPKRSSAIT